jgi:hypothetical protein
VSLRRVECPFSTKRKVRGTDANGLKFLYLKVLQSSGPSYKDEPHVRQENVPRAEVARLVCDVSFYDMDRKELEVEVERILLKKARHRKLTKREELILAYTHYAAGCSTCYAMIKVQR